MTSPDKTLVWLAALATVLIASITAMAYRDDAHKREHELRMAEQGYEQHAELLGDQITETITWKKSAESRD